MILRIWIIVHHHNDGGRVTAVFRSLIKLSLKHARGKNNYNLQLNSHFAGIEKYISPRMKDDLLAVKYDMFVVA